MPRKSPANKEPNAKNSTCRTLGHDWMSTAAAHFRVCTREKCRAFERLVNGEWVSNAKAYRTHDPAVESGTRQRRPQQCALWESSYSITSA